MLTLKEEIVEVFEMGSIIVVVDILLVPANRYDDQDAIYFEIFLS